MDKYYREPDGPYESDLSDPDGRWLSGDEWKELQARLARAEQDRIDANCYLGEPTRRGFEVKKLERQVKEPNAANIAFRKALLSSPLAPAGDFSCWETPGVSESECQ